MKMSAIIGFNEKKDTKGGPPRKIVPCLRTMTTSSDMAGTYAPPAVHEPSTTEIY